MTKNKIFVIKLSVIFREKHVIDLGTIIAARGPDIRT